LLKKSEAIKRKEGEREREETKKIKEDGDEV
jgi:hypothetical protein